VPLGFPDVDKAVPFEDPVGTDDPVEMVGVTDDAEDDSDPVELEDDPEDDEVDDAVEDPEEDSEEDPPPARNASQSFGPAAAVVARSAGLQALTTHVVAPLVMSACLEAVHWHAVSSSVQPDATIESLMHG